MPHFATISQIIEAAQAALPVDLWDYAAGGAEDEVTLRRNRQAFERLAFRARVLRGVGTPDLSVTVAGQRLAVPFLPAPVGSINLYDPGGTLTVARAAHAVGTAPFIGLLASPLLEEVRAGTEGPLFFQLYAHGPRDWAQGVVERVQAAGYAGLALTVDTAAYGRRERDLVNGFSRSGTEERPNLAGLKSQDRYQQALMDWEYVDWLRAIWKGPLMVKGIQCAEDAVEALQHGVDVVYVSNHGGRQLDHGPATIEVLPEIVAALRGKAEVIVDSGFVRGTDIAKALALGANAVGVGKLSCFGLAAGGQEGLERVFQLLRDELTVTMQLAGAKSVSELTPACLRPGSPVA